MRRPLVLAGDYVSSYNMRPGRSLSTVLLCPKMHLVRAARGVRTAHLLQRVLAYSGARVHSGLPSARAPRGIYAGIQLLTLGRSGGARLGERCLCKTQDASADGDGADGDAGRIPERGLQVELTALMQHCTRIASIAAEHTIKWVSGVRPVCVCLSVCVCVRARVRACVRACCTRLCKEHGLDAAGHSESSLPRMLCP